MSWGAIVVGVVGTGVSLIQSERNRKKAEQRFEDAEEARKKQQEALDIEKRKYLEMEIKNPFANLENVYEDLTVNQQQAQFMAQQGAQQRANIMEGLRGAAGSSGIAGLAQSLANQGALQTQRISGIIGQQESRNQLAAAKGAAAVQIAERQGAQYQQQTEMNRQATLLGMQAGQTAGALAAEQQAIANQMNAELAQQQIVADMFGVIGGGLAANASELGGDDNNIFTKDD